jgi:hypothetical protein
MKKSTDTIGNRTRDLPVCSAVSQPTVPPRLIGCPKTSVTNYQSTLFNTSEERKPHLHRCGSLKTRIVNVTSPGREAEQPNETYAAKHGYFSSLYSLFQNTVEVSYNILKETEYFVSL